MIELSLINSFILLVLFGTWLTVTVMAKEFYETAPQNKNRFRFRYWFVVGILNMFHVFIAFINQYIQSDILQDTRWLAFMIIDIFLLEIFIVNVKTRRLELYLRVIFYMCLIFDMATSVSPIFVVIQGCILLYTAIHSPYKNIPEHFKVTFILYICMGIAPYIPIPEIGGFTHLFSLVVGMIYSIHLAFGVKKFYEEEKILEAIKRTAYEKAIDDIYSGHIGQER